ncbi:MAG: hypothetical protein ACRDWE_04185 [Acidimicrobiales bacterium]
MAARIRTLADAVNDLTAEVARARTALPAVDVSKLDGRATKALADLAQAVQRFSDELAMTNGHLRDLAHRPIVGFLGGGAEAELQRLAGRVDALREQLELGRQQLAPR